MEIDRDKKYIYRETSATSLQDVSKHIHQYQPPSEVH